MNKWWKVEKVELEKVGKKNMFGKVDWCMNLRKLKSMEFKKIQHGWENSIMNDSDEPGKDGIYRN